MLHKLNLIFCGFALFCASTFSAATAAEPAYCDPADGVIGARISNLRILSVIVDQYTMKPVQGAEILVMDEVEMEMFSCRKSNSLGETIRKVRSKSVGDEYEFTIAVLKDGYLPGFFNLEGTIEASQIEERCHLTRIEKGVDLMDYANIEEIGFDEERKRVLFKSEEALDRMAEILYLKPNVNVEIRQTCLSQINYASIIMAYLTKVGVQDSQVTVAADLVIGDDFVGPMPLHHDKPSFEIVITSF